MLPERPPLHGLSLQSVSSAASVIGLPMGLMLRSHPPDLVEVHPLVGARLLHPVPVRYSQVAVVSLLDFLSPQRR